MTNFDTVFNRTLKFEGIALTNDPNDPGHLTFCGISRRYFPAWQGWAIIDQYLKITPDVHAAQSFAVHDTSLMALVEQFFKVSIWNQNKLAELNDAELATQVYDAVVNPGPVSIKALQGLLSVGSDGIMGQKTIDACNFFPSASDLVDRFLSWRKNYYQALVDKNPNKARYLRGWLSRCVRSDAA